MKRGIKDFTFVTKRKTTLGWFLQTYKVTWFVEFRKQAHVRLRFYVNRVLLARYINLFISLHLVRF